MSSSLELMDDALQFIEEKKDSESIKFPKDFKFNEDCFLKNPWVIIIGISGENNKKNEKDESKETIERNSSYLPGVKNDVKLLKKLFGEIYKFSHVSSILDLIDNEIIDEDNLQDYLIGEREKILKHKDIDGILLFYCGHGNSSGIIFSNGDKYLFSSIWATFNNKQLPQLIGKPKLFHWDCCRGNKQIQSIKYKARGNNKQNELLTNKYKDMCYIYSNIPGYTAYENKKYGYLTQSLYIVYSNIEYMLNNSLDNALTRIKQLIGHYSKQKQSCEMINRLDYVVYLKPNN